MNLTERRHSVHSLIASPAESFEGAAARGRVGDWRTDEGGSSLHSSVCFFVGCSDYPAGDIESVSSPAIIFHDNVANLAAATDINFLSAIQYAVEICRVKNIFHRLAANTSISSVDIISISKKDSKDKAYENSENLKKSCGESCLKTCLINIVGNSSVAIATPK